MNRDKQEDQTMGGVSQSDPQSPEASENPTEDYDAFYSEIRTTDDSSREQNQEEEEEK